MTDPEFLDRAESLLRRVETQCDVLNESTDADIDNQRVGGMVTLTFANRSQIIINLQKPLHEVWMATRSGGYHYRWREGDWVDTKGGLSFWVQLSADATVQSGWPLRLDAGVSS